MKHQNAFETCCQDCGVDWKWEKRKGGGQRRQKRGFNGMVKVMKITRLGGVGSRALVAYYADWRGGEVCVRPCEWWAG